MCFACVEKTHTHTHAHALPLPLHTPHSHAQSPRPHTHARNQTAPRNAGLLRAANASGAAYLFQPDKLHGDADIGDKSLQCGRKSDALKLW